MKEEKTYQIILEGMEFFGYHGCREDEKVNGNDFSVDFTGDCSGVAGTTDNLDDAVNYGRVYDCIAAVMTGDRCNLLETLAARIVSAVSKAFPEFTAFKVTVRKKNPPVNGPCAWSGVSMEWKKDE